jgi:hypothetical protein
MAGALARAPAEKVSAQLLSPAAIYKLKKRGFGRTASRLLTLAAQRTSGGALALLARAGLPADEHTAELVAEAKALAHAAPAPAARVPLVKAQKTVRRCDAPARAEK